MTKEGPLGGQRQEPWRKWTREWLPGRRTSAESRSTSSPWRRRPLQHFALDISIALGKWLLCISLSFWRAFLTVILFLSYYYVLCMLTCVLVRVSEERLDVPRCGIESIRRFWTSSVRHNWMELCMCRGGRQLSVIQRLNCGRLCHCPPSIYSPFPQRRWFIHPHSLPCDLQEPFPPFPATIGGVYFVEISKDHPEENEQTEAIYSEFVT